MLGIFRGTNKKNQVCEKSALKPCITLSLQKKYAQNILIMAITQVLPPDFIEAFGINPELISEKTFHEGIFLTFLESPPVSDKPMIP